MALHSSALRTKSDPHDAEGEAVDNAVRLVVLDFDPRWTVSTIDIYGEVGPGWIMGPERDYPVIFQEHPHNYRTARLREEIAELGGTFFLKPDLDDGSQENPLIWYQAAVAVPVAQGNDDADHVAAIIQSISLAVEQSGLFTVGSVATIRNPKQKIESVDRDKTKPLWRQKWRGSWRGGELLPSNKYG